MAKVTLGFTDESFPDDKKLLFGDNDDYSIRYDSATDTLVVADEGSGGDAFEVDSNADLVFNSNDVSDIDEVGANIVKHATNITQDYTIDSGEGTVLAGPISGSGSISGNGQLAVV